MPIKWQDLLEEGKNAFLTGAMIHFWHLTCKFLMSSLPWLSSLHRVPINSIQQTLNSVFKWEILWSWASHNNRPLISEITFGPFLKASPAASSFHMKISFHLHVNEKLIFTWKATWGEKRTNYWCSFLSSGCWTADDTPFWGNHSLVW